MRSILKKISKKMNSICNPEKQIGTSRIRTKLNHKILVGTHHKIGTVWMGSIFKKISQNLGLVFYSGKQKSLPENFDIFFEHHSYFDFNQLQMDHKGLHLVRDPRDTIISGCFYHQKAKEKQLHIKKDKFGGLTYQEKINSYDSLDDKLLFEMEYAARGTIVDMLKWDYSNSAFMEVKYEELVTDINLLLFHKIFTNLEFSGEHIPEVLRIAYDNSLFSGNLKKLPHVRSGRPSQWKNYFKPIHKKRFIELFGDALIKLGYENNNDWAN